MTVPLLVAAGLTRRWGRGAARTRVVHDVSLDLIAGEVAALVGGHGAGKTTLLRLLAGVLRPHAGRVTVAGYRGGTTAARRVLGFAPDGPAFPPALRVRDVLDYYARLHEPGPPRRRVVARAVALVGLEHAMARRAATLSPGERTRLSLAQAMLGSRRVVLVDEPFAAIDREARAGVIAALQGLARAGGAVLVASRDPGPLERLATRVLLLDRGRMVADGALGPLVGGPVLELVLDPIPPETPPGLRATPWGFEAELSGTTVEAVLALCRARRLAVRASRVREGSLEDAVRRLAEPPR